MPNSARNDDYSPKWPSLKTGHGFCLNLCPQIVRNLNTHDTPGACSPAELAFARLLDREIDHRYRVIRLDGLGIQSPNKIAKDPIGISKSHEEASSRTGRL